MSRSPPSKKIKRVYLKLEPLDAIEVSSDTSLKDALLPFGGDGNYAVYHDGVIIASLSRYEISTSPEHPLVVKPYLVWVRDGGELTELASNPMKTIPILLADHNYEMNKVMVTLGNKIISEGDSRVLVTLGITKEKPICILYEVKITVFYEDEQSSKVQVKLADTINDFLQRKYHNRCSIAFTADGSVLPKDRLFKDVYKCDLHLCIKSKRVPIIKGSGTGDPVDLTTCEEISDVLTMLNGTEAWYNGKRLDARDRVDDFLFQTPSDRLLFLLVSSTKPPSFRLSCSVSACANDKSKRPQIESKLEMRQVSSHWLAIEIYNQWADDGTNRFNGIVNNLQKILACEEHELLLNYEKCCTALLSLEFDKLVKHVRSIHQIPLKHAKSDGTLGESVPDFYLATMSEGIPKRSLLIADFKKTNFEQALVESFGYCFDVVHQTRSFEPIITIPGSMEKFSLYLCFPITSGGESKLVTIKIKEAKVTNVKDMKCFLSALTCALEKLQSYVQSSSFVVEPQRDLKLMYPLNRSNRVFLHEDYVYKLYDENIKPQIHIIKEIDQDYLPGLQQVVLSAADETLVLLKYKFMPQKSLKSLRLIDFKPILETLDKLHGLDYVHSDIRIENIVFLENASAKLIDFDLAGNVGTRYPIGYNKSLECRHPEAQQDFPRQKCHDRFSIISIIKCQQFAKEDELQKKLTELLTDTDIPLSQLYI